MKVPQQNSEQEVYWFPTPEDPEYPLTFNPIQQRIYNELSRRIRKTQPTRQRSIKQIIPLKLRLVRYNTQHSRTETNGRISHRFSQHFCKTTV